MKSRVKTKVGRLAKPLTQPRKNEHGNDLRILWIALCLAAGFVVLDSSRIPRPQLKSPAALALKNSPKEVCEAMIDAAKREDLKTIRLWSLRSNLLSTQLQMAGRAAREGESRQAAERGHVLSRAALAMIQELSCKSEHIAGNRAMVEAETKDQKRLIPFIQKDGKWMFDVRTYQSFYRDDMAPLKSRG